MKKVLLLGLAVVIIVLLMAAPALAETTQYSSIVWKTGTGTNWYSVVGGVVTTLDGNTLRVTFNANGAYRLLETHLAVGDNLLDIPHNNGGPIPGRFPYSNEYSPGVASDSYVVDVTGMTRPIFVAAHAVLVRCSDGRVETGWGTSCKDYRWAFPGANWARFIQIG